MLVDLVQTTTRDGLRLDGALQPPAENAAPALAVDAFCLVHGTGGSFYSSTLLEGFAERLLKLGCWVLRANTRGHDLVSTATTARGGRRQGAAYEVLDECRHDLAAWVDFLRQRAGPRVGLLGHSSGALKCLYAPAQEPALDLSCVVAVSPPRLSYSWFCSGAKAAEFLDTCARAERLVESGQPAALLDVTFPLPFLVTAAGYLEKYGPDERYNYLRFAGGLGCPVLWTFGAAEVEGNVAFQGAPEAVRELATRQPGSAVEVVAGADHFYTGRREEVIERGEGWLRTL
ncbi:MAG: alpha/beta fold hydrolase [Gemmataceae bacterium]|nr:alpha/beta fold hydrolase [Gemmataceae bacterium]